MSQRPPSSQCTDLQKQPQKTPSLSIKLILALIPASLILGSCTNSDLRTAREFSETAGATLEEQNTAVSQDIYDSCARSSTWIAQGTAGTRQNMRDALEVCDTLFRPNSVRTRMAGLLLVEYVKAIGDLATEDREAVKTRFQDIGDALKALQVQTGETTFQLNQNTIDTGVEIASFITNLLQNDLRRRHLKTAILCTDSDIQSYSADFSSFIDELYVQALLDDEIDSITRYFAAYRSPLTDTTNLLLDGGSPEVFTALQETQMKRDAALRNEIEKVIEKKNLASTYVRLIRETATAHADLKRVFNDGKDELSPKWIRRCEQFFANAIDAKTSLKEQETDDPELEITLTELEQARRVTTAYIERVTPLLDYIQQHQVKRSSP